MFFSLPQKRAVLIWPEFFFREYIIQYYHKSVGISQGIKYLSTFSWGIFRRKKFQTSVSVKLELNSLSTMSRMIFYSISYFQIEECFLSIHIYIYFCQLKNDMFLYIKGLSCNSSKPEMHKTKNCTSLKSDPNWKSLVVCMYF